MDDLQPKRTTLSIVIVNWRSGRYVHQCVLSIDRYLRSKIDFGYEVIVVDNTPCDPELAELDSCPRLQIVQNPANLGFARACNIGSKQARGELLLFLNPDTEFVDDSIPTACDWLLANTSAGVVGCRQVGPGGDFQADSIQKFPTILNQLVDSQLMDGFLSRASRANGAGDRSMPVEAVSGAFMLIKKAVFHRVGGFSENYFMYAEDVDLCHKLRKAGYGSYYMNNVRIIHRGGISAGAKGSNRFSVVMSRESTFRFFVEHQGKTAAWNYRLAVLLSSFVRLLMLSVGCLFFAAWSRRAWNDVMYRLLKWRNISSWALGLEKWVRKL